MNNYIDMWTGWHVALATWGFMLAKKLIAPWFPNVHDLFVASASVIVGALLWELIADVWLNRKAYATRERLFVNSFFDMVAAFLAIAACLVIESIG